MFSHYSALKGCARRAREGPRRAGLELGPSGPAETHREGDKARREAARPAGAAPAVAERSWQRPLPRALRPQLLIHTFPPSLLRRLVSGRGGGAAMGARGQF